jgi:hypothetical protein
VLTIIKVRQPGHEEMIINTASPAFAHATLEIDDETEDGTGSEDLET